MIGRYVTELFLSIDGKLFALLYYVMVTDLNLLSEKISQLAGLVQSLRCENADLRLGTTTLLAKNADLSQRMQQAQQRVFTLLEKISVSDGDKGAV